PHGHDHHAVFADKRRLLLFDFHHFNLSSDYSTLHLVHSVIGSSNPIILEEYCNQYEESVTSTMFLEFFEFWSSSTVRQCTETFRDIRSLWRIFSDIDLPALLRRLPDTFTISWFSVE